MASVNPPIIRFDGGIIGERLHNRVDTPTYPNGAEDMVNFRPNIQGTMSRRPPLRYLDTFANSALKGELWPFVFAIDDTYLILATSAGAKFYATFGLVDIPSVSSTISAGAWTDVSDASASATIVSDQIVLDSPGGAKSIINNQISVQNIGISHTLAFEVVHGPVSVRIGANQGGAGVLNYENLDTGFHRLSFTPSSSIVHVQFHHDSNARRFVRSDVSFLAGTSFDLPLPYAEADLPAVQYQQIKDVLYLTHIDYITRRIERRGDRSWSITLFEPSDGPFKDDNITSATLRADQTTGEALITANQNLFAATDVGTLYKMTGEGQRYTAQATAGDVQTGGIKVTGIGSVERSFTIEISGTFTGIITLQRSSGNEEAYTDWRTYGAPTTESIYDARDNQTWYYRLNVKGGEYGSGTIDLDISFEGGTTTGIVRVVQYNSPTEVLTEVIRTLANTSATSIWAKGAWNYDDGYPTALTLGYGRLWFGRDDTIWCSKADDFTSFDAGVGDEADLSFSAQIGAPSSNAIRWLSFANHLVIGTASEEKIGLGNTNSEIIGPSNFQIMPGSEEGGASIQPVQAISSIVFVHRTLNKLMQFTQDPNALSDYAYISVDLTSLAVDLLESEKIVDMAILREPERRIFVTTQSGKMLELLFRREGDLNIVAWSRVETKGRIDKITVLPRSDRDVVYCIVRRRQQDGTWQRHIEYLGDEQPVAPDEYAHLDSSVVRGLEKPDSTAEVSGTSGTITITTDDPILNAGVVGSVIWINGGRGVATAFTSATQIEVNVTAELKSNRNAASGSWGGRAPSNFINGLDHLDGQTVSAFGDNEDLGEYIVSNGQIILNKSVSWCMVGYPVESRWKSLKLSYGGQKGTALTMPKMIKDIVLCLFRSNPLDVGPSFERMWPVSTRLWTKDSDLLPFTGETKEIGFDGGSDPDARLCIRVAGAGPCTVAGLIPRLETRDR